MSASIAPGLQRNAFNRVAVRTGRLLDARSRWAALVLALLVAGGCQSKAMGEPVSPSEAPALASLKARFDTPWSKSTYMIATVQTPEELWNVYVVSIPPNQVAIRQSRQDGEYEFGLVDDLVWHVAFGNGRPSEVGPEWAWFIRNHEIFRFSDWLQTLEFTASEAPAADAACREIRAIDQFSLEVTLCVDDSGDPIWIERTTPPAYGETPLRIEILEWADYEGRRLMKKYRQIQHGRAFEWEVQALLDVPGDQRVRPPENLLLR